MDEFFIRKATLNDVPFLVETIIEAEKSGTDKLSYSTVFDLSLEEVRKYLADMFNEEVDGCELSVSSFLVAELDGQVAAAASAWIEGSEGISSSILKGNLLSYILPKKCIQKATSLNPVIRDLHIEYTPDSIQVGSAYVSETFRGKNLCGLLISKQLKFLSQIRPDISKVFAQLFECNLPSIRMCEKLGFKTVMKIESANEEVLHYLPFNKKILMTKELFIK
ncbi:MAG: GNAT family N-acetyltransferase [Bacteroidales bacterium]|jgi:hypothetical protein